MEQHSASPHIGIVVSVEGNDAVVHFQRSKLCQHCGACMSVGDKEVSQRIENTLSAKVGDLVEVYIPPRRIVQASLLAYLVPLVMLLLGVWLGSAISDVAALVLGLIGCAAAYLILRALEKRRKFAEPFRPRMVDVIDASDVVDMVNAADDNF